jgi:hypothetical protein
VQESREMERERLRLRIGRGFLGMSAFLFPRFGRPGINMSTFFGGKV